MTNTELIADVDGFERGIEQAAEQGYAFVPGCLSERACNLIVAEAASLDLELGDHIQKPINEGTGRQVTQMHKRCYREIGHPDVPVATMITNVLAEHIRCDERYPELSDWLATEMGYQMYSDPTHHISKHRDRKSDKLLAATITAMGAATVTIHEPLGDPNDYSNTKEIDAIEAEAGTVMLLRAPGLDNGEQVIHEVSPPKPDRIPRLIINLRMRDDILPYPAYFSQ